MFLSRGVKEEWALCGMCSESREKLSFKTDKRVHSTHKALASVPSNTLTHAHMQEQKHPPHTHTRDRKTQKERRESERKREFNSLT